MGCAIPCDHDSGLSGAEHERTPSDGCEHRRELEVVVAHVVSRDLVVPRDRPARRHRDERVRVQGGPRERPAVRVLLRAAVGVGVRDAPVDRARCDARRIPRAAASGLARHPPRSPDRRESPAHLPGRRRERVERAAAVRGDPDRADVDRAVRHLGRDVDVALGRPLEQSRPEELPVGRRERERRGVGCAVHASTVHDDAVRAGRLVEEPMVPAHRPGLQVEREDVALHVLDVHDAVCHDGRRGEHARGAGRGAEAEAPRHAQRLRRWRDRCRSLRSARVEDRSRFASGQSPPPAADATPDVPMTSASAASSGTWRRQNLCSGCVFSILVRTLSRP